MHVPDGGTASNSENVIPFAIKKMVEHVQKFKIYWFYPLKNVSFKMFLFSSHLRIKQLHLVLHLLLT